MMGRPHKQHNRQYWKATWEKAKMTSEVQVRQVHEEQPETQVEESPNKTRQKRSRRTPGKSILQLDVIREIIAELAEEIIEHKVPRRIEIIDISTQELRDVSGLIPESFDRVLQLAMLRRNIMLVGPAGCGKTYLAKQISEALGLDFSSISCTAGMSESQLLGWLLPTGANGQFEYRAAPFITMYEKGGVFLLDELDSGDSNTLMILNQALSSNQFTIPQRLENPIARRHPDFVCIAACNTYGQGADIMYVGRNQLDAATLDRFMANTVTMTYSPRIETALVDNTILEWALNIRMKIDSCGLRRILSTRVLIDFSLQKENFDITLSEIEAIYFANWTAEEVARVKEA